MFRYWLNDLFGFTYQLNAYRVFAERTKRKSFSEYGLFTLLLWNKKYFLSICSKNTGNTGNMSNIRKKIPPRLYQSQGGVMVPATGIEPVRILLRGILSPLCLPIPPCRRGTAIYGSTFFHYSQAITQGTSCRYWNFPGCFGKVWYGICSPKNSSSCIGQRLLRVKKPSLVIMERTQQRKRSL